MARGERAWLAKAVITASWALVVIPRTIQSLTAPKLRAAVGEPTVGYTQLAQLSKDLLTLSVLGVCALAVLEGLRKGRGVPIGPLAVALAPWLYLMVRDQYVGGGFQMAILLYPAIVLAIWSLRPSVDSLELLGVLIALTAIGCIAMGLLWPDSAIFRSSVGETISEDKQILPWGMLEGYLTQPNNLGQTLATGLPAVFLVRSNRLRVVLVALTGLALVWTASRSSLYATVAAGIVASVLLISNRARHRLAIIAVSAVGVIICTLPFVTSDPTAFTNRGYIWNVSIEAWDGSPWIGHGSGWYQQIASTAANLGSTVFHGHNQFVQLLVTGGVLLAGLVIWQYGLVVVRAVRLPGRLSVFASAYLVALLGTCVFEVSLPYVDNFSMLMTAALPTAFILFGRSGTRESASDASSEASPAELVAPVSEGRIRG